MRELLNQKTYQCEFCDKRFITKRGAHLHEEKYCWKSPIPKANKAIEIMSCEHDFQMEYTYIAGEAIQEPSHKECIKCGVEEREFERMKAEQEDPS